MANRLKWTKKKKREFCLELIKDGNVTRSCDALGVGTSSAYVNRDLDEAFKAAWDEAQGIGDLALVDEARKRAMDKSDILLMFLIKAKFPEYRDKFDLGLGTEGALHLHINTDHPDREKEES